MNFSSNNSSKNHCNIKTHPHKTKGVRSTKVNGELTLGREIELGEIPHYMKHAIVGGFCGKTPGREAIMNRIEQNWKNELGYSPYFHILPRGWFMTKLRNEEDGKKLLDKSWR